MPLTFDDIDVTIVRVQRDQWVAVAGEPATACAAVLLVAHSDHAPPYSGKGADPNAALADLRVRWTAWMTDARIDVGAA